MAELRIAINGAAGRMGRRLVALSGADPNLKVVAALEKPEHPRLDQDAGAVAGVGEIGVLITGVLDCDVDVVIDFSMPEGAAAILKTCLERSVPLVLATTGLDEGQKKSLRTAAEKIPLLWAPNMSLAVNLVMKLAQQAALALKDHPTGADVEIIERHHRFKEDAPSGTALRFGEIIASAMGQTKHQHGREGRGGSRPHEEIGYHALRTGDNPGEHTIVFGLLGETIELSVQATNRDCYAYGALAGAKFLAGQSAGLYDIQDVLGL